MSLSTRYNTKNGGWPKEFKRWNRVCLTPVLTLWGGGHIIHHVWRRVIVPLNLAWSFGAICAHYHYRVIHCEITDMRAWFESTQEKQLSLLTGLTKSFGRLSYKKIRWYNNSLPYMTARWPPQQIPPLNFLGVTFSIPLALFIHSAYTTCTRMLQPIWIDNSHFSKYVKVACALLLYSYTPRNFKHLAQCLHILKCCMGLIHLLQGYQHFVGNILHQLENFMSGMNGLITVY